MQLEIKKEAIEAAIQKHLDETVQKGIDYQVTRALNDAVAEAVTPEIVQGFVEAAMQALTDKDITQRIVTEMNAAIAESIRLTMQEAVVAVAVRLRGYSEHRNREDAQKIEALRERLFPSPNASDQIREE